MGVFADVPAFDVKYIRLTNIVSLFISLALLIYLPIFLLLDHPAGRIYMIINLFEIALFIVCLWLNKNRHYQLATNWMIFMALVLITSASATFGNATGVYYYLCTLAVAPVLLFGHRHRISVWLFAIAGLVIFLLFQRFGQLTPAIGPPFSAIAEQWFYYCNLTGLFCVLFSLAFYANSTAAQTEVELDSERERSERLLLNILPEPIANRLKSGQESIVDAFAEVTVLFADISDFSGLAKQLSPTELVELLNQLFSKYDEIAENHGLEKIKTIGDAYMAAAGLPQPRKDHAHAAAAMAIEMLAATQQTKTPNGVPLKIRIGLNSGPVVAGVIGKKRFIYDLWGDTVNLASRMESHGSSDQIHMTTTTRNLLNPTFTTVERGEIDIKGIGSMRTWFLDPKLKATL